MTPGVRALTATDDVLAHTAMQVVSDGPGAGTRVLAVSPAGGLHTRVLLDRGLDLGATWYGGEPVAWLSAMGEQPPGHGDSGEGWHDGWAGGLLTTCGLQNVGLPSEGHGRHGRYSDLAATDVSVARDIDASGAGRIVVSGTVHEPHGLGRGIRVRRQLGFPIGAGVVTLEDVATNLSAEPLHSPLLYHLNLGYPFLGPDSILLHRREGTFAAAAEASPMGPPAAVADEVAEHDPVVGDGGTAVVAMRSARLGMQLTVEWDTRTLPRLFHWQRRAVGTYVSAIEPANCSVQGRAADRASGRHPVLAPGETRRSWLRITVERTTG